MSLLACKKPEEEKQPTLDAQVSFTVVDEDGTERIWSSTSAYAEKSPTAYEVVATNQFGERINLMMKTQTTGVYPTSEGSPNVVRFKRIKAQVDSLYSTKKSGFSSGQITLDQIDPTLSALSGRFIVTPYATEKRHVELTGGEFIEVPFIPVNLTETEILLQFPDDTITPPIDPLACPDSTAPCFSFSLNGQPYVVADQNLSFVEDELGRLYVKVLYDGVNELNIGLSTTLPAFSQQENYVLGKNADSKGFLETSGDLQLVQSGALNLQFNSMDSLLYGNFEAVVRSTNVSAEEIPLDSGRFFRIPLTKELRTLDSNRFVRATIGNHQFISDSVVAVNQAGLIDISGSHNFSTETIRLTLSDTIGEGTYAFSGTEKGYFTNYYGLENIYTSGSIEITQHDTLINFIRGTFDFQAFDFSETKMVTISQGSFSTTY